MFTVERKVISQPLRVMWGGWESTTTRLQQCGWEISVDEQIDRFAFRIAMRHQGFKMYGLSKPVDLDYFSLWHKDGPNVLGEIVIPIVCMATKITVNVVDDLANFAPVDAYPQIPLESKIMDIEDYRIFATPLARTQEIIVNPEDVGRMLELIKGAQQDMQADIRARERMRERREGLRLDAIPQQQFHAQILSFSKAA